MKKTITNCDPGILNQDTFMTGEHEFLTVEIIKERCICNKKSICIQIVEALDTGKNTDKLINQLIAQEDLDNNPQKEGNRPIK